MVFTGEIRPETKAFVRFLREESGLSVADISKRCNVSRASVYRCLQVQKFRRKKTSPGRPRIISVREERIIERNIQRLRQMEGIFSCHRIRAESGLHDVTLHTMNRTLKRMGYHFMEARKKGILSEKDRMERMKFARAGKKEYDAGFFKHQICFYLDGVSFWYKRNPMDDARAPQGKIWRRRNEGLHPYCTAKGSHTRSGGKVVKMLVAVSYSRGVIFLEQYETLDGAYYANFIRRNFRKMFRKSGKRHSRLFLQDNCPILNCAKARNALNFAGAKLFEIPKRSADLNPIENVFNLVKRELKKQARTRNITCETFEQFSERVKSTLYAVSSNVIDKIISSMYKRLDLISKTKGNRTKY